MTTTILDALGSILATAGYGTVGTDIFLQLLPDTIGGTRVDDACIGVFEYGGSPPVRTMNGAASALERPRVNVICRAAVDDAYAARLQAARVRRTLGAVAEQTVSGLRILAVVSTNHPEPLGVDHQQRPQYSVAFEVTHAPEILT